MRDPERVAGMARFGIDPASALGVRMPALRALARDIGRDHALAGELWASRIHEARILASLIDEPDLVTPPQMDAWAAEFASWGVCDQCCMNLFRRTPFAYDKVRTWAKRDEEFVKRAAFALLATLAVHDKRAPDETFLAFMTIIERGADDERNFVKKAVSWALRQIGKRNARLHAAAREVAARLVERNDRAARWVGADALRELDAKGPRGRT